MFQLKHGFTVNVPIMIAADDIHKYFYAPKGTSGGILKSHCPSVRYKSCLSDCSLTTKENLMKFHRKIKDNVKVCHPHDLGSYSQGQGHNQVRGPNCVSAITQKLLKQI